MWWYNADREKQLTFSWHARPTYPTQRTPEEFREQVKNYFRQNVTEARLSSIVNYPCVSLASMDFERALCNPQLAHIYYTYILEELEEFLVRNRDLLLSIQQLYVKSRLEMNGYQLNYRGLKWDNTLHSDMNKIYVPYYERKRTKFPPQYLLAKPFLYQDFECIKKLLRFNIPQTLEAGELYFYTREVMQSIKRDSMLSKIKYIDAVNDRFDDKYLEKRRKLVLMSVHFLLLKREGRFFGQNCIDSLKLVYQAIPDAKISSNEVRGFLLEVTENLDMDTEILIDDFCKIFEEEFPESVLPVHPRSLKQFCRIQIRSSLQDAAQLPKGAESLGIPNSMKKYILLE